MIRSNRGRTALVASCALVVGGLLLAFVTRGADPGSSTLRTKLPQPRMTTVAGGVATLAVPATSAGDVLVSLSGVPGKKSTMRVPHPGLLYDLYVACVTGPGDGAGPTVFELTDGPAGASTSGTVRCDGREQPVFTGPLDSKIATASLTGNGISGVRGWALLSEH